MRPLTLTAVPGVRVGHWTHTSGTTGCTVILFPEGAAAAGLIPGSAPGSREIAVLDPSHIAPQVHAFCLSGGSAFGLAAADGVMQVLADQGIGFQAGEARVPIVPAVVLFDLETAQGRPDAASGRAAALAASADPVEEGKVGAGAGARVAKHTGQPQPGGLGSAAQRVGQWTIGALAAVNAFGSIRDPESGAWLVGGTEWAPALSGSWRGNTTLVVVATDAPLSRPQCVQLARMAQAGFARAIDPVFTPVDGDSVLVAATGQQGQVDALTVAHLGQVAASCVAQAIVRGVTRPRASSSA